MGELAAYTAPRVSGRFDQAAGTQNLQYFHRSIKWKSSLRKACADERACCDYDFQNYFEPHFIFWLASKKASTGHELAAAENGTG